LNPSHLGKLNLKKASSMALLAINILESLYVKDFPIEFIQSWIEDSSMERIWVDHPYAQNFIEKILTVFNQDSEFYSIDKRMEAIQFLLNELQSNDKISIKNQIKILQTVIQLKEARLYAAKNMENWLNHPSAIKLVWDLLASISDAMHDNSNEDLMTISHLIQMKVKSSHSQDHADAIQKLMLRNEVYPIVSLRTLIELEIKQPRPTNYSRLIQSVFKVIPHHRDEELGRIMQEIASDSSNHSSIRLFTRRMIKILCNLKETSDTHRL
jgi:hypothetical protein